MLSGRLARRDGEAAQVEKAERDDGLPAWDYAELLARAGQWDEATRRAIRKWARAGQADAQYLHSLTLSRWRDREKWLWRASYGGNIEAYAELHVDPLPRVLEQAEAGSVGDMVALGVYYATLRDPDLTRSCLWYRKAALLGCGTGMYEIGLSVLLGEDGPANPIEAVKWLEGAAMSDSWMADNACNVLSDLFAEGRDGVPKDLQRADHWRARYEELQRRFDDEE